MVASTPPPRSAPRGGGSGDTSIAGSTSSSSKRGTPGGGPRTFDDSSEAIAAARGIGGVTRPAGRNSPTTRTLGNPSKRGKTKQKGGRGSDPPEGSGRTDAPTQGWGMGRRWRGSGPSPAKRPTTAKLLHTRPDASTRRARATHIRARPTRHPRVRGCRGALGGRGARPAHTSGGEWPHAGRTARNPPSDTRECGYARGCARGRLRLGQAAPHRAAAYATTRDESPRVLVT